MSRNSRIQEGIGGVSRVLKAGYCSRSDVASGDRTVPAQTSTLIGVETGRKTIPAVHSQCPLRVKSGHVQCTHRCPLSAISGHGSRQKRKDRLAAVSPKSELCFDQAAACAFRFLRQPSRPNAPRPVANRGRAPGSGTGFMAPNSPSASPLMPSVK